MKNSLFFKIIVLSICCTFFFPFISFAEISSNLVTTGKIDSNLSVKLQELSDSEKVSVYVYMSDDSNDVISSMEQNYPNLYTTYTSARTGNDTNLKYSVNTSRNQNMLISAEAEVLQNSLEVKRQLYNTHYSSKNTTLLAKHCSDESLLYVSSYSPMAIVSVTTSELKKMMLDPDITKISLFENKEASLSSLTNGNLNSRASYVRDTFGNQGQGVKIGQVELAVPNTSDTYLSSANIITNTSCGGVLSTDNIQHATYVARIMVGSLGIAPSASLYSASAYYLIDFYRAIDWLVSQGVNVINMSAGFPGCYGYDDLCAYVDHLAVEHDVHFVGTPGNNDDTDPNYYIYSPGMAYNAIIVGAYNDNNTAPTSDSEIYAKQKDDFLESYSKYIEGDPQDNLIEGPCKPNLVASGNDFWGASGTSLAAPQVTGVIAQLCGYDSALKVKQSSMGAILAASCGRKLASEVVSGSEIISSGSFKGGDFSDSASLAFSNQISNTQGAGKLDAYWARTIVAADNYWSVTLEASERVYEKNIYITKGNETLTRIAIYWLKRNSVDDQYNITQIDIPDWDIEVFAPDGTTIATSMSYDSNFEIVQFVPPESGIYRIELFRANPSYSEKSYVGIAVW